MPRTPTGELCIKFQPSEVARHVEGALLLGLKLLVFDVDAPQPRQHIPERPDLHSLLSPGHPVLARSPPLRVTFRVTLFVGSTEDYRAVVCLPTAQSYDVVACRPLSADVSFADVPERYDEDVLELLGCRPRRGPLFDVLALSHFQVPVMFPRKHLPPVASKSCERFEKGNVVVELHYRNVIVAVDGAIKNPSKPPVAAGPDGAMGVEKRFASLDAFATKGKWLRTSIEAYHDAGLRVLLTFGHTDPLQVRRIEDVVDLVCRVVFSSSASKRLRGSLLATHHSFVESLLLRGRDSAPTDGTRKRQRGVDVADEQLGADPASAVDIWVGLSSDDD